MGKKHVVTTWLLGLKSNRKHCSWNEFKTKTILSSFLLLCMNCHILVSCQTRLILCIFVCCQNSEISLNFSKPKITWFSVSFFKIGYLFVINLFFFFLNRVIFLFFLLISNFIWFEFKNFKDCVAIERQ